MYKTQKYAFEPGKYEEQLIGLLRDIKEVSKEKWNNESLRKLQTKYPKDGKYLFSKNDLIRGYHYLVKKGEIKKNKKIRRRIKMKPIRTQSGVAPVTVLTKPWPCPGNCIYCPNEPNMPKSYIANEPGAQRAAALNFDPYLQVQRRIQALQNIGHNTEKVELIVLGGTWSYYPKNYQKWFIKRCFEALNNPHEEKPELEEQETSWQDLEGAHKINETAKHKCVGLSLETRPDLVTKEEAVRMRHLGATKVQIGVQTLRDDLLKLNKRGHTVAQTKKAFELLRLAGFKIQAHWMVNLFGATPEEDLKDFKNLWSKDFHPDELKIYPTSVIDNTKLYELYKSGQYEPYPTKTLTELVADMKLLVPEYCRITRVIRDIPAQNIVAGSKTSNLRQVVHEYLKDMNRECKCVRCREIRSKEVQKKDLKLAIRKYETSVSNEYFLSYITPKNEIAGFLRLSVPLGEYRKEHPIKELENSAMIREIHVYGQVVGIGKEEKGKTQHLGLGKKLIQKAEEITQEHHIPNLQVISAIGTREYYKKRGFKESNLYQKKGLI